MVVRVGTNMSRICFWISKTRIRVRSPPLQNNPAYNSIKGADQKSDYFECGMSFNDESIPRNSGHEHDGDTKETKSTTESINGNRIMIVVDSSQEAKGALQWALSHTVQKEDTIILLHISKPSKRGSDSGTGCDVNPKAYGLLYSMKSACQAKRPGVQVETVTLKGNDKGPLIVKEAKQHKVSLLVLGHKRRSVAWRLLFMRWTGKRSSSQVVDYCIQHAESMTIAVRRKSKKLGGYLITTKRHKKFWLLA